MLKHQRQVLELSHEGRIEMNMCQTDTYQTGYVPKTDFLGHETGPEEADQFAEASKMMLHIDTEETIDESGGQEEIELSNKSLMDLL